MRNKVYEWLEWEMFQRTVRISIGHDVDIDVWRGHERVHIQVQKQASEHASKQAKWRQTLRAAGIWREEAGLRETAQHSVAQRKARQ